MIKSRKSVEKTKAYVYPTPFIKIIKEFGLSKKSILKLDYNEPTIRPSPKVVKAISNYINKGELQWYPGGDCEDLRTEIAKYTKQKKSNIIVGNGSDEILKVISLTYLEKGDEIIVPTPNYPMFIIDAEQAGSKIKKVPLKEGSKSDVTDLVRAINSKTKIIYISNPNSPFGYIYERNEIIRILEKCKDCLLIVDEAYYEFYGKTVTDLVNRYDNLIVTRTFSKAFSLASLRLGYAIANKKIINDLTKVKDPESVNTLAQIAGIEALKDSNYRKKFVSEIIKSKKYLKNELTKLGLEVYTSYTNFLFVKFPNIYSAKTILNNLEKKGIFLRDRTGVIENCVRIGVPLLNESKRLVKEINKQLKPLLILDIDGVLIDVSKSYRIAIKKTAEYFTKDKINYSEIQELKNKGGYNNDWDLTEALILKRKKKINKKKIINKFQSHYLGRNGLINNERLLIKKKKIQELSKKYDLAIFTGRPRKEALFILKKFGIKDCFKEIIAMEDTKKQKPNPDGLLKILKKIQKKAYYFGDTIDDITAAKNSDIVPTGVLPPQDKSSKLKNILKKKGAKSVIYDINQINKVVQ